MYKAFFFVSLFFFFFASWCLTAIVKSLIIISQTQEKLFNLFSPPSNSLDSYFAHCGEPHDVQYI